MTLRDLTTEEIFPLAYQKDLLKKQSEHFVNNGIMTGTIKKGYEDFPLQIITENQEAFLEHTNPPHNLIGNYFKNNWRVILTTLVVGGIIWYSIDSNIKKSKQKLKN